MLVAVAVLAMLAFFVLPPFLQMGGGQALGDPVVAAWNGGEIREGELERAVALRTLSNRFLMQAAAAAGRDPSRLPSFPEGEELLVREMILAREAEKLGMTVSNNAINEFLSLWTNNMVRQNQFDAMIAGLRYGRSPVSAGDLFDSLRTALVARNMLLLFQTGFSGDPPGWRWDFYKRLEQAATVEAFPVAVEDFALSVPAPSEAELKKFFDAYKNNLPEARSPDPGFKEPHRIRYASLMAEQKKFEDEAAKTVTDADVKEYYETNKATRFRSSKPATAEPPAAESEVAAEPETADATGEKTDSSEPSADPPPPADSDGTETESAAPSTEDSGSVYRRQLKVTPVALRAAEDDAERPDTPAAPAKAAAESAEQAAGDASEAVAEPQEKEATEAEATEAKDSADSEAPPEMTFQPLAEVADQIRQQLTSERATQQIDAIFSALAADLTAYAEDRAVWLARGQEGTAEPVAPDIEKIASKQGLVAVQSDWIAAPAAVAAGGIGSSFEFVPDPGSRFGVRQQRWVEMIFGDGGIPLRPITSRDAEGNRYFSWKQDDQEERIPTFAESRETVEKAWRIVAARPQAEKRASEIASEAGEKTLKEAVGEEAGEKVLTVGPFTWLTEGSAGFGAPPMLSSPSGLVMPGESLMRAVFTTPVNAGTTAFNEPQTFCYALRVIGHKPAEDDLRKRFAETQGDQRRIGMVAQQAFGEVFTDWIDGLEKQTGLTWKRDPRPVR